MKRTLFGLIAALAVFGCLAQTTDRLTGLSTSVAVKPPVAVVTNAPITLSGEQTVNGVAVVAGNRVLVKDQADATANGIYVVATTSWARAADFDGARDVVDGTLIVSNNDASIYYRLITADPITIGSSELDFEVVSGSVSQSSIGSALYPRTAAEITAGVTPNLYYFPPGDVRRYGATCDGVADDAQEFNAAYLSSRYVDVRFGGQPVVCLIGSQLTMQDSTLTVGAGRTITRIKKGFNGDLYAAFTKESGFVDIWLDGNGASFTGRLLTINGSAGRQYIYRSQIVDAESYCIEFTNKDAGSQSEFVGNIFARYDGLTAGKYAIKIPDDQQLAAKPRKFVATESNGTHFLDLGGSNGTYVAGGGYIGEIRFTGETRGAALVGNRLGGASATMTIDGFNNHIVGNNIGPDVVIDAGAGAISLQANTYNGTVTDNSGLGTNLIDLPSVAYTPAWTGTGSNPSCGDCTLRGEFSRAGDKITAIIDLIVGSTTTFGSGTWEFSLPTAALMLSGTVQIGTAFLTDAGTTTAAAVPVLLNGESKVDLRVVGGLGVVNPTTPWTWATGDSIRIHMEYIN